MFKNNIKILLILTGVLITYQNCGQAGKIITNPSSMNSSQIENGNSSPELEIVSSTPTNPLNTSNQSDTDTNKSDSQYTSSSNNNSNNQTPLPSIDVDHPKHQYPEDDMTQNPKQYAHDDKDEDNLDNDKNEQSENVAEDNNGLSKNICNTINASDVLLNVSRVSVPKLDEALELVDENKSISLLKQKITLKALKSGKVSEVRLILASNSNLLLDESESVFALKTPSGQSSGFKLKLDTTVDIKKDSVYVIYFDLDLQKQFVSAGNKCILKPVIHSASLTLQ